MLLTALGSNFTITDSSLEAIAEMLPPFLRELDLAFSTANVTSREWRAGWLHPRRGADLSDLLGDQRSALRASRLR